MKRAAVVIGANFGDEGKGLMTDYLCSQDPWATVVRFNGGAQAGHTVETPSGQRHVFHHFGSGTFANAYTYLGPEFLVNPVLFWQERNEMTDAFGKLPALDVVRCHPQARLTTPYDMILNQLAEEARGGSRHGSCGVGIGETVARGNAGFGISVSDIDVPDRLARRLSQIERNWFFRRAGKLGITIEAAHNAFGAIYLGRDRFMQECTRMRHRMILTEERPARIVFEGAQGLMLDQNHRFFPYVTRSNTGLTNVLPLAHLWGLDGLDVTYVTRAYLTRHGAGPMPNECREMPYEGIVDKTNVPHPFQGSMRYGFLDLDLLAESIRKDLEATGPWLSRIDANIALTCADQIEHRHFVWHRQGKVGSGTVGDLMDAIREATGLRVQYVSFGPTRSTIEEQF